MNQFLQNFLHDASGKLEEVGRELQNLRELEPFDEANKRRHLRLILQQIHTLKGSAAAFGIETVRELAHALENLLDSLYFGKTVCDQAALSALEKGVESIALALAKSSNKEDNTPALPHNLKILIDDLMVNQSQSKSEFCEPGLPAEFLEKLNELEKRGLQQVVSDGRSIYVLEVEFHITEFQNQLQALRAGLEHYGEIIAALPGGLTSPAQIALRIIFAANVAPPNWKEQIEPFNPKILFTERSRSTIVEAATQAFLAGRNACFELGKEVDLNISGGDLKITGEQGSVLTTALLHLIVNAVAHGIESPAERLSKGKQTCGTIQVKAEQTPTIIYISVIDDGGGIDFEKIAQAAEKIYGAKPKSEDFNLIAAQQLIFQPGFSTTEKLSQVSGRGIGLDAAKSSIESVGGTIEVSSRIGAGTIFKIILPRT